MMPLIYSEEHEASESSKNIAAISETYPHLSNKISNIPAEATSISTTAKNSAPKHSASSCNPERKVTHMGSKDRMMRAGLEPALETTSTWFFTEESKTLLGIVPEDSLQWLQALELQVVGACRTDERLRPLLRYNVSCYGSDGKLLAHVDQHFKVRELASLERCLSTPVVSLRVGKVSRYGQYLHPTAARGYLNLMLLPCSEMRILFADDVGMVETVAITSPGMDNGGILIQELKEDASKRTFLLKDRSGECQYFWQSENLKTNGDELITKIRSLLKSRPTVAHLTGIEEGKLESFVNYLRTTILSNVFNPSSQVSIVPGVPSLGNGEKLSKSMSHTLLPLRKSPLKFFSCKELFGRTAVGNHTYPSQAMTSTRSMIPEELAPLGRKKGSSVLFYTIQSSMNNLHRCMNEIHKAECSIGPDGSLSKSRHSSTVQLIDSLKRLQNCLRSLSDRRSEISLSLDEILPSSSRVQEYHLGHIGSPPDSNGRDNTPPKFVSKPLITTVPAKTPFASHKYLPVLISLPVPTQESLEISNRHDPSRPCPPNCAQALPSAAVAQGDLVPALDLTRGLQTQSVLFYPSDREFFVLNSPCQIPPTVSYILSRLFAQLVSQISLTISHLSNKAHGTHILHVLQFLLKHDGASSFPHLSTLSRVRDHLRRVKYLHLPPNSGCGVPSSSKTLPMFSTLNRRILRWSSGGPHPITERDVVHPSAKLHGPGDMTTGLEPTTMEISHDMGTSSTARCRTCHRCETGLGLSNLVLFNFYTQQIRHGLRVVTAEITSGNISYIVVRDFQFCFTTSSQ